MNTITYTRTHVCTHTHTLTPCIPYAFTCSLSLSSFCFRGPRVQNEPHRVAGFAGADSIDEEGGETARVGQSERGARLRAELVAALEKHRPAELAAALAIANKPRTVPAFIMDCCLVVGLASLFVT